MAKFPSVAWFDAVRRVFNGDEAYQGAGGGHCNCVAGIKVGNKVFVLTFEALECSEVVGAKDSDLERADFCLEMPLDDWRAMVRNIAKNGNATLEYTLNTLDLEREEGLCTSRHGDQYREDLFFRYNQTFQFFFDASARVNTTF